MHQPGFVSVPFPEKLRKIKVNMMSVTYIKIDDMTLRKRTIAQLKRIKFQNKYVIS